MTYLADIVIDNRYQVVEKLGQGAMGSVFRAYDRLHQHEVALKRVLAVPQSGGQSFQAGATTTRMVLANEFQTLASLRHPNVIYVLDYGFDSERQPFFTMNLLQNAKSLTVYARDKSTDEKVSLLLQTAEAIAYLHRRNVIHRDLKPDNTLVTQEGVVKVLDFGLAMAEESQNEAEIAGTIAYMSPEILSGGMAGVSSDLYAIGIMGYELFAGHHPFNTDNVGQLVQDILTKQITAEDLDVDEPIGLVIERLVQPEPLDRYPNANALIDALYRATKQDLPLEVTAIRDSFLQAADFVGREQEFNSLQTALLTAKGGTGSVHIIGGESGVGKSRLVNEIRIRALVEGALVLQGQGVTEGGVLYQLWRDPIRRLLLDIPVDDFEAGVLKQIIPDIEALVGRDITDVAELQGDAGKQRLLETILAILKRSSRVLVLFLEDLQWAVESLDVLRYLIPLIEELSLLIVGTYRDDEAPQLMDSLTGANEIKLSRLSDDAIEKLTASMLGEAGHREEVLTLLKRETEGNVFFLVEVVRALAEDAGRLNLIGLQTLPMKIFAGGMQQVIQRRLHQVPTHARELLEIAAVAGRFLDLKLLQAFAGDKDLEAWLLQCSDVAVLDVMDEQWRFAHDKLREGLLASLSAEKQQQLYSEIAEKMQQVHTDNVNEYAMQISDYYEKAGQLQHAALWHHRAAHHAKNGFALSLAAHHFERVLDITRQVDVPIDIYVDSLVFLGEVKNWLAQYDDALKNFDQLLQETQEEKHLGAHLKAYRGIVGAQMNMGNLPRALEVADKAEALAREHQQEVDLAALLWYKGWAVFRTGDLQAARIVGEEVITLAERHDKQDILAQAFNLLGAVEGFSGNYNTAEARWERALKLQREIGEHGPAMATMNNLGWLLGLRGNYEAALEYLDDAIEMARDLSVRREELIYEGNRGGVLVRLGRYEQAELVLLDNIKDIRQVGLSEEAEYTIALAEAQLEQLKLHRALDTALEAFAAAQRFSMPNIIAECWQVLGRIAGALDESITLTLDDTPQSFTAVQCFEKCEAICDEFGLPGERARNQRAWAYYDLARGNLDAAQERWTTARELYQSMGADAEVARMPEKITDAV